jgi:2'-5' RNA ligase
MTVRLFAALPIPDDVAERVAALQQGVDGARWAPRENLHLTLRFFGNVAEPVATDIDQALEEEGRRRAPFSAALKGAGFFGKGEPHVLYLGVAAGPGLQALAAGCERAARRCGLEPDARKFTAHLTVAYLNGASLERVTAFEQRYALFESRPWEVDSFGLYSSQTRSAGPSLYRLEAEYPLCG